MWFELPSATEIVSSTSADATIFFQALSPFWVFAIGIATAVIAIRVIWKSIQWGLEKLESMTDKNDKKEDWTGGMR